MNALLVALSLFQQSPFQEQNPMQEYIMNVMEMSLEYEFLIQCTNQMHTYIVFSNDAPSVSFDRIVITNAIRPDRFTMDRITFYSDWSCAVQENVSSPESIFSPQPD